MKKVLKWVGIGFVGLVVLGAIVGDDETTAPAKDAVKVEKAEAKPEPVKHEAKPKAGSATKHIENPEPEPEPKPKPEPVEPAITSGQENGLPASRRELHLVDGTLEAGADRPAVVFRWRRLSRQSARPMRLTTSVRTGTRGRRVGSTTTWTRLSRWSQQGLLEQLTSSAGDKFTYAQAQYAVNHVLLEMRLIDGSGPASARVPLPPVDRPDNQRSKENRMDSQELVPAGTEQPVLLSEEVIVEAPFSYVGGTKRIVRSVRQWEHGTTLEQVGYWSVLLLGLPFVWMFVTTWYITFGLFLVPYRLIRRSHRKGKLEELRHREELVTIASLKAGD